jgi:hypothetical protein
VSLGFQLVSWKVTVRESGLVLRMRPDESETESVVICTNGNSVVSRKYIFADCSNCSEESFDWRHLFGLCSLTKDV